MLLVLVLPSALVPATMAFSSVFPQVGRRRKARTETAAWAFPSTSVSSGRDSSDWDREKGDFSGLQRQKEALNILRAKEILGGRKVVTHKV